MTSLEELKKFTQQEMTRIIKENLDSGIIFTYIQGLEDKIKDINTNYISKDKIKERLNYIKSNYSQVGGNYFMMEYQIDLLEEMLKW